MRRATRFLAAAAVAMGWTGLATGAAAQATARPRPGLTAQQTKEAIGIAQGALRELRKKAAGTARPDADPREYVVGVELLAEKKPATQPEGGPSQAPAQGPKAVVTSYRYSDDTTVFSTVDLVTGRVTAVEAAQHLRTPLSDAEYEEAKALARAKSDEVKKLYERFGDQIGVYPQFSQFRVKEEARIHRVVHLTYRIGTRDLSHPRPMVDLTTRMVETPSPDPEPGAQDRRR